MKKVLVFPLNFSKYSDEPKKMLEEAGFEVVQQTDPCLTEDEVIAALKGYDGCILATQPITARVMDSCPCLKVIARYGVGLDNVDLPAAKERGVLVTNTPGANAEAVADCTIGMMLDLAYSLTKGSAEMKKGNLRRGPVYYSFTGATIGIIGMGAIGKAVAHRARAFNMEILGYDVFWDEAFAASHDVKRVSLQELFSRSDFITIHTNLSEETRNLITLEDMKAMKPSAILINNARGGIVNEADLYTALSTGVIAGAGLDVFCQEPPVGNPLIQLPNVVCTPHIAASTIGALKTMGLRSAGNCISSFRSLE